MKWEDKYRINSSNLGGGQGDCFIVIEIETGKQYFLKKLKKNTTERRQRFFRETTLFKSLNTSGIPKIIDTNVNSFETSEELFYCAEFIKGKSLEKISKPVEFTRVVDIFRQLLNILIEIHDKEIVHRDIKPENILIDETGKLFLVDFGISVNLNDEQNITSIGQELGNRFIRLPEFSAGSTSKRDSRSDLTLACGIALFLFSGKYPRVLVNENGQFAHQTDEAIKIISKIKMPFIWNTIFDKAFQIDMSKRWSSAKEIIDLLNQMENIKNTDKNQIEEQLKLHAKKIQNNNLDELKNNLISLNENIKTEVHTILRTKAKGFRTENMGQVYNLGDIENKNQIRAYPIGKKEHVIINIQTVLLGEQVIGFAEINNNKLEVCRIRIGDKIEKTVMEQLKNKLSINLLPELGKLL
jgi:serine/threonine-protein kinase